MTKPLPKWIQIRYAPLWKTFKEKEFTFEQAEKILKNHKKGINMFFSDLKKAGWVEVKLNKKDTRKRIYKIKNPNQIFNDMNNKK